mgnify:CR=1 FL=1
MNQYLLIIDFGSQTTHLIGRKLRELGVNTKIVNPENIFEVINYHRPQGIIFSGGPASVYEKNAPSVGKEILAQGIPILGICYGWQLIAHQLGGKVVAQNKEYGPAYLKIIQPNPLLTQIKQKKRVWLSHGDTVKQIPLGFEIWAETDNVKASLVGNCQQKIYGVQFHPEIEHTQCGQELLKNFSEKICGLSTTQNKRYGHDEIRLIQTKIKAQVGDNKVICAVSGGVDSTVAAVLIGKTIGNNLIPVHIDSGLNRPDTKVFVKKIFKELLHLKPIIIDARKEFLKQLAGVTNGAQKRKIIGKLYIDLFWQIAKANKVKYLAQGTVYSDVIESKGTKHSSLIKYHHNVGGLPKNLKFKLIEPLRDLYKDEVRNLGLTLGIPQEFVFQQKFPGPGYAIRIMGEVTAKRLKQLSKADQIVLEEIKNNHLYDQVFHSFAIMTGIYTTALKGDKMQFLEVVGVRILTAAEEMTADWAKIPYPVLEKISLRIVNEVPDVSRVVYDITTKPPSTMEWE